MEEKTSEGKYDLPQSLGYLIARLIHQKFPREVAAINRDGTRGCEFSGKSPEKIDLGAYGFRPAMVRKSGMDGDGM